MAQASEINAQELWNRAPSDLQLPSRQWGTGNVYLLVLSKAKHYRNPHCRNVVVDHLGPTCTNF